MGIEQSFKNAIKNGKSNGITRFINDTEIKQETIHDVEVLDSNPINDEIQRLERRKALIEEITTIENSIVGMHETLMNQKKIADNMMSMALGGLLQGMTSNDEAVTDGSFDMECMNLASLSQSRLYSNQRDFHERVLLYKKAIKDESSISAIETEEISVEKIQQNLDNQIKEAVKKMSTAVVVSDEDDQDNNEESE